MGVRSGTEIGRQGRVITSHGGATSSINFYPVTDMRSASGGLFNFEVHGTFVGTVIAEKTFDDGTTWVPVKDIFGNTATLTAAGSFLCREVEAGVAYRTRCSAYTSGTAVARLSQ